LTSFRRNGQGVSTPVGITINGDKAYFTTWSTTGKVKRLANNPHITLAPCKQRGAVIGPAVGAIARRLEGEEAQRVHGTLGNPMQRWFWKLIYKWVFRADAVLYEVVPSAE
jgi:PPOX class probable F420-dependent enzyme